MRTKSKSLLKTKLISGVLYREDRGCYESYGSENGIRKYLGTHNKYKDAVRSRISWELNRNKNEKKKIIKNDSKSCLILLSNGKYTIVDTEDVKKTIQYNWQCNGDDYAVRSVYVDKKKRKCIFLHDLIMNNEHKTVDHINHDTLDNRKSNLRIVTKSQNMMNKKLYKNNKTGIKGVTFSKKTGKYMSRIQKNGKSLFLGEFQMKCQAVKVRKEAEIKHFGEYRSKI